MEYVAWQIFHYPTLLHTAVCSPQMALCRWRDPMGGGCPPPEAQVDLRIPLDIYLSPCALWSPRTNAVVTHWRKDYLSVSGYAIRGDLQLGWLLIDPV